MHEEYNDEIIKKYLEEDIYYRQHEIKKINDIISRYPNIKLGINAKWGDGKTVIAKEIYYISKYIYNMEDLKTKYPYLTSSRIIYFDASKEDIFNMPLLSIAKVICEELDEQGALEKHNILGSLVELFESIPTIGGLVKFAHHSIETETPLKDMYSTQSIIDKIKSLFNEEEKYILLVDELDRCNPQYVLDLLSTIKHFFDIKNLSIIYFYNYEELWNIVQHYYGYKDEQYLQKFIDYEINLSTKNFNNFSFENISNHISKKLEMAQIMYDLNPRELNNLYFLLRNKNLKNYYADLIIITHVIIKRNKIETLTEEYISKLITKLEYIYPSYSIEEITKLCMNEFNIVIDKGIKEYVDSL